MLVFKSFVVIFALCFVHGCLSKPTENDITEGRGIMTSIWGWITYPFSWWSSGETDQPVTEQLVGSTTNNPNDVVDIRSHNVTIWCNDQTCNTMKCDKIKCRNITCSIYDTDFRGECREYNIITNSDEVAVPKTTETAPKVDIPSQSIEENNKAPIVVNTSQDNDSSPAAVEHPLELEAVLSSTVNKLNPEKVDSQKDTTTQKTQV